MQLCLHIKSFFVALIIFIRLRIFPIFWKNGKNSGEWGKSINVAYSVIPPINLTRGSLACFSSPIICEPTHALVVPSLNPSKSLAGKLNKRNLFPFAVGSPLGKYSRAWHNGRDPNIFLLLYTMYNRRKSPATRTDLHECLRKLFPR
jgi:hypothetical protein